MKKQRQRETTKMNQASMKADKLTYTARESQCVRFAVVVETDLAPQSFNLRGGRQSHVCGSQKFSAI